jgi:hypothetical protein
LVETLKVDGTKIDLLLNEISKVIVPLDKASKNKEIQEV